MAPSTRSGGAGPHLLATKLHAPRRRREVVRRSRLTEAWALEHQPALVLVSAPAGFGKTTLLAEWFGDAAAAQWSVSWLALDAGDNDPAVFGAYLVAALRSIAPQLGSAAEALLQGSHPLPSVVAALVNDVESVDGDVALVLDDYHVIDSPEVHDAVAFLVEHAPIRFHLVVATRADPALPLARWRARGDLVEVRAADLRFTAAEATSYFADAMGLDLSTAEVGALEARTEGWIAALQLAALSLRGRTDVGSFIDNFAGDDRFVLDYLVEEVLERQPEAIRDFLLRTAVLDRLNGSLCDEVTGASGGKATLEQLERANLFLVALDDRRHWYRYHHLFADVLRARLADEQPALIGELHRRASEWYGRNGETAEAVSHAMAGGHVDRAARLIEVAAPAMRRARQESTLRRWLEALPDGLFDARPVLLCTLAGARMATGDPTGVGALLDAAEPWLDPSVAPRADGAPLVFDHDEFARLPAQISVLRAGMALISGDTAATIGHASRVLELAGPTDHLLHGAAGALLGLVHWSLGDLDEARRRYAAAVDRFSRSDFVADFLGCSLGLADIQIAQGHLRAARRTYEVALELARGHDALRGTADMHVGLSELALEADDLEEAERHLHAARDLGEHLGLPQHPYRWRAATARLRQAHGDLAGALELLEEAEPLYNTDFSPPIRPIAAVKARLQLARGDVAAAVTWAADRGLAPTDDVSYVREYEHVTLARTLLARPDGRTHAIGDALGLLDLLFAAAEGGRRESSAIEILTLLCVGYDARGDRRAGEEVLDEALVRAAPEGHVRVFLDAGQPMIPLLRSTRFSSGAAPPTPPVFGAWGAGQAGAPRGSSRPRAETSVEELSGRERDVLRLLRSDLTGPEMARELHVSLNTIRSHTKSIYTKLGVTSRRAAIRRADEHGL